MLKILIYNATRHVIHLKSLLVHARSLLYTSEQFGDHVQSDSTHGGSCTASSWQEKDVRFLLDALDITCGTFVDSVVRPSRKGAINVAANRSNGPRACTTLQRRHIRRLERRHRRTIDRSMTNPLFMFQRQALIRYMHSTHASTQHMSMHDPIFVLREGLHRIHREKAFYMRA